jgi:hypothetical protein
MPAVEELPSGAANLQAERRKHATLQLNWLETQPRPAFLQVIAPA